MDGTNPGLRTRRTAAILKTAGATFYFTYKLLLLHPFNGLFSKTTWVSRYHKGTKSSAIAEGPRDVSCQLKSCQLRRNSAETTCMTSLDQIDVMKLEV